MEQQIHSMMTWLLPLIIIAAIWDMVWKMIALWKSARDNHLVWFVFIAIFNTLGILPIIYILLYKKKPNSGTQTENGEAPETLNQFLYFFSQFCKKVLELLKKYFVNLRAYLSIVVNLNHLTIKPSRTTSVGWGHKVRHKLIKRIKYKKFPFLHTQYNI